MQRYTSQKIVQFFKLVTSQMWGPGMMLHLHRWKILCKLHIRPYTQTQFVPIIPCHLSVFGASSQQKSGLIPFDGGNSVDTLHIRSYSNTSVSFKGKVKKLVKQRRRDPVEVARNLFYEIRERHKGHILGHLEKVSKIDMNNILEGPDGGNIHSRSLSKINVINLFDVPGRKSDLKKIISTNPVTQTDNLEDLSTTDLLKTLHQMHLSHKHKLHENKTSVLVIESILCERIKTEGLNVSLDIADALFMMQAHHRHFVSAMFDYVTGEFDNLEMTVVKLTRLMFYMFLHGSAPPDIYPKIEEFLSSHIHEFDINDLSIVSLGFFRSLRRIESTELLEKIADKLLADIDKVFQFSLVNILKAFRHSGYSNVQFFENLAETMINRNFLKNCSNVNLLMHIASTYASLSIFHSDLLEVVLKQFVNIVSKYDKSIIIRIRSKDLAKFIWAYGVFVFEPVKHWNSYMKLVSVYSDNMDKDDSVYPESLADILQGLMYLQIFPPDLISKMFNIKTAIALRDDEVMRKAIQLLMIHNAVIIECPQYTGSRLDQSFVETLSLVDEVKKSQNFELSRRRGLAKVWNTLKEMFGDDCVHCHFILPQFRNADIELRFNENKEAVKFEPQEFNSSWLSEDKLDTRIAIEVAGLNQFCMQSSRMKGNYDTKLRQLRMLGYHVVLITPHDMDKFKKMSADERKEYLTQCLQRVWDQSK